MLSPKGAGFLYARPEVQPLIEPLVVSWGFHPNGTPSLGSQFLDYLQWSGTHDPAAALAVPDAIRFMDDHNWGEIREACRLLVRETITRICELSGLQPSYPPKSDYFLQMAVAPLPAGADLKVLKTMLLDDFSVEVPLIEWEGQKFIRISIQAYNDEEEIDTLLIALKTLLSRVTSS
jgi:isopenicillin-N epimerase